MVGEVVCVDEVWCLVMGYWVCFCEGMVIFGNGFEVMYVVCFCIIYYFNWYGGRIVKNIFWELGI